MAAYHADLQTYRPFRVSNSAHNHVSGLWKEAKEIGEISLNTKLVGLRPRIKSRNRSLFWSWALRGKTTVKPPDCISTHLITINLQEL